MVPDLPMAKITITIEDKPDNKVAVRIDPSFETLASMVNHGEKLTSAQAYAMFAVRMLREESKRKEPTPIFIPRLGR